jgi:hypothetical protein
MAEPKEGSKDYKGFTGHDMHHDFPCQQVIASNIRAILWLYAVQHVKQVLQCNPKGTAFKQVESSTHVL